MSAALTYKMNLIKERKRAKNKSLFKLPGDGKPCQFDLGVFSTFESVNTSFYYDTLFKKELFYLETNYLWL